MITESKLRAQMLGPLLWAYGHIIFIRIVEFYLT